MKREAMPDVQASCDSRNVAIDRVGVKDVTFPIRLRVPQDHPNSVLGNEQTTVANISMYVALPHYQKGTHMSRFLEVLNEHAGPGRTIAPDDIPAITAAIRERLDAEEAHFEAEFTYFINKSAPVTGSSGLMDYRVTFECTSSRTGLTDDFVIGVMAPAASLCPCSKEISAYGAHNQRCLIEAKVRFDPAGGPMWIEHLAEIIERAASCPVFAVLKRPDEKWVTEHAYDNPKFVEDIIRDLAVALNHEDRIIWYAISSENFESIHNHNAYAQITRDKRD
ncbi:MAG: GTP cyclohydrolase I FolE2 [Phycisphaeraceae bacterium]|nr:GTP cyclohydrolase I FolE2 [Phycisphaeraceae bacterium]